MKGEDTQTGTIPVRAYASNNGHAPAIWAEMAVNKIVGVQDTPDTNKVRERMMPVLEDYFRRAMRQAARLGHASEESYDT